MRKRWLGIALFGLSMAQACSGDDDDSGQNIGNGGAEHDGGAAGRDGVDGAGTDSGGDRGGAANGGAGDGGAPHGAASGVSGASDNGGAATSGGAVDGPVVVAVTPTGDSVDVDPLTQVHVTFSEPIDVHSLTAESARLLDGDAAVTGAWSCDGVECAFAPSERLSLLVRYDLKLSRDVAALGGARLQVPLASSFRVRDGVWSAVQEAFVGKPGQNAIWDQILRGDDHGDFLLVWGNRDGGGVWARWYRAGQGLSDPVDVRQAPFLNVHANVSVAPGGDAIVGWVDSDYDDATNSGHYQFFARRFVGAAWEAPKAIGPVVKVSENFSVGIKVAIDDSRAVMLGSVRLSSGYSNFISSEIARDSGDWQQPRDNLFSTMPAAEARYSGELEITRADDAVAMFTSHVFSQAAGEDWQDVLLPTDPPAYVDPKKPFSRARLSASGDSTLLAWFSDSDAPSVDTRVYSSFFDFSAPFKPGSFSASFYLVSIASDRRGFWAAWRDQDYSRVETNHLDPITGSWQAQSTIVYESDLGLAKFGDNGYVDTAFDPHGNGLILFHENDALDEYGYYTFRVAALRFDHQANAWSPRTWVTPHTTDPEETDEYEDHRQLVVSANGTAMVVFWSGFTYGESGINDPTGKYCVFE